MLRFYCLVIPKGDLTTKKTKPESIGVYNERRVLWSTLISIRQTDVDRLMIRTQSKG